MTELTSRHCAPCNSSTPRITGDPLRNLAAVIPDWQVAHDEKSIERRFEFKNYYETMSFVNAVAWIAHREDHHPDLEVGYSKCRVRYSTHANDGLSENDFICAAKVDALLVQGSR
jgi:4a-hydroxytetrahydrobiopterin dehydratase